MSRRSIVLVIVGWLLGLLTVFVWPATADERFTFVIALFGTGLAVLLTWASYFFLTTAVEEARDGSWSARLSPDPSWLPGRTPEASPIFYWSVEFVVIVVLGGLGIWFGWEMCVFWWGFFSRLLFPR